MLILISASNNYGQQTISPQKLEFTKICAGVGQPGQPSTAFNSFKASFTYSGFSTPNFILEMSDPTGSFTTLVIPTIISSTETGGLRTIIFAVPTTLIGSEKYKLRVKETISSKTSGSFTVTDPVNVAKISFAAYYKNFESGFYINNQQKTATICSGGGKTILKIDDSTTKDPSPLGIPSIKYQWYKIENTIPVAITGEIASSLVVSAAGEYFVDIDYGSCTDANYTSNRVTVNVNGGSSSGTITASPDPKICEENGLTTLTPSTTGNSYQWYFNKTELISGATNREYSTDKPGEYSVLIDFGGCTGVLSLLLESYLIQASINSATIQVGGTATVTTNDVNVKYQWFFNDVLIPNETGNTFSPIVKGKYKAVVTQATGCKATKELPFVVIDFADVNVIPNIVSPNNDGSNDTWIIPQEYLTGSNAEIVIYSSQGDVVLQTTNYQNNFPVDIIDFNSINPVYYYTITTKEQKVIRGSITVLK